MNFCVHSTFLKGTGSSFADTIKHVFFFSRVLIRVGRGAKQVVKRTLILVLKRFDTPGHSHWSLLERNLRAWRCLVHSVRRDVEVCAEKPFPCLCGRTQSTQKTVGKRQEFLCKLTALCNTVRAWKSRERLLRIQV